jgi:hypothetical protein
MKEIALVFVVVLVTAIVPGTVYAAETTPVYPGMGGAPVEILTNMYPTVKANAHIMGFIGECGVGSWHEEGMNADFKTARLFPANSCGKQLVFSIRKSVGRDDPTQIGNVWIIDVNETWSDTMDPVYPSTGNYRLQGIMAGAGKVPPLFVAGVAIALTLIGIAFALISRRK